MDEAALEFWNGVTNDEDPTARDTDYGRACEVEDWVGAIPVAEFSALVFGGDDTLPAAVLKDPVGTLIIRTFSSHLELPIARILAAATRAACSEGIEFAVGPTGTLRLFDSGFSGRRSATPPAEYESRLPPLTIPLSVGQYRVHTTQLDLENDDPGLDSVMIHLLRPTSSGET